MPQQTGFLRPELLALLLAVPVLLVLLLIGDIARRRALMTFAGRGSSFVARSAARRRVKIVLAVLALSAATLAAAGPYVDVREREVKHLGVDIVIAVDISQSMAVRDVAATDRLRLARDTVETLSARLVGSRIALALFANEGVVRYPATTDPELLGRVLDNSARGFRLPPGSSLRAGLSAALAGFPDDVREGPASKAVVVISDGEYAATDVPELAPYRERGIRIFALGVGTTEGGQIPTYDTEGRPTGALRGPGGQPVISRLNDTTLRAVADGTGGRYWRHTGSDGSVPELVRDLRSLDTSEITADGGTTPDDRYQIVLAVALALLLLEWLVDDRAPMPSPKGARPERRVGRVRRLPWSRPATLALAALAAVSCTDALAEQNQVANTLYARGDVRGALARYRDLQQSRPEQAQLSVNAGNALYRLQEHSRALADYGVAARSEDAKVRLHAHYGRGSALFRQGKLDEARDAFKDALRADPTDRDAKFNIEVIDHLQAARRTGGQAQPAQPGQPGQAPGQPGQQPGQPSQQPGQPGQAPGGSPAPVAAQPGGTPGESLDRALLEFRRNLTEAEALRLLDALARDQGGIEGLLEGQLRGGNREAPY